MDTKTYFDPTSELGKKNITNCLMEHMLLRDLPEKRAISESMADTISITVYEKGQSIYQEKDFYTHQLYFVLSGSVKLLKNDK